MGTYTYVYMFWFMSCNRWVDRVKREQRLGQLSEDNSHVFGALNPIIDVDLVSFSAIGRPFDVMQAQRAARMCWFDLVWFGLVWFDLV